MSELKLCPFCGEQPELTTYFIKGTANHTNVYASCSCGHKTRSRKGVDGAIADWNTRPIEDALKARIAELEAQLAEEVKYEINEKVRKGKSICEACGGDGSLLLTDGYKGQVVATVECIYCNGTGYVDESPNDTQTDSVVYGKDSD